MSDAKKTLERVRDFRYFLILEAMAVGILAGLAIVLFRMSINHATEYMALLRSFANHSVFMAVVMFFILFTLAAAVGFLVKTEPLISGSGIPQVKGELLGEIKTKWYKVLVCKFLGAVIAIGSGLSLGREGPSIQIGALVGKGFSKITKKMKTEEKLLMTCGAAAGLAAAFNAPLAGVVFSLEELHKNFSEEVLLSTMAAAITSDFVCRYVFGLAPIFSIDVKQSLPLRYYGLILILGIFLGAMGVFYNKSIEKAQNIYGKIKSIFPRIVVPFLIAGIFSIVYPYVLGGGSELVDWIANGNFSFKSLLILLILKYIFSMVSFGSGSPGGIFLPLLVLGSIIGGCFFCGANAIFGMDSGFIENFVILGMAGYFAAIVRSPITGIILISEMTGSLSNLLPLSIVSLTAYVTADVLKGKPIYDQLLGRMTAAKEPKKEKKSKGGASKILIETPVYFNSGADGITVCEMQLSRGALIVSLVRGDDEIVPYGDTEIRGGDKLVILCNEDEAAGVNRQLSGLCRKMKL